MIGSVYIPFFYIQDYALKLGVNDGMAIDLLSIMNAARLFERLIPNWLADRSMCTLIFVDTSLTAE
jgi:hypothetical protein